jgi:hypothetical protein
LFLGGTGEEEGEETSGSENKTCLVAARLLRSEPGSLLLRRGLPGVVFAAVQALRRLTATTSSRELQKFITRGLCQIKKSLLSPSMQNNANYFLILNFRNIITVFEHQIWSR